MFITKKHLSRRTLLRGLGASLSLPLLDAMIPAGTALAQTAAAPKPKMGFFYFPHGAVMDRWTPAATGRDFELPQILEPLAPFKRPHDGRQRAAQQGRRRRRRARGEPGTWLSCTSPFWPKTDEPFCAASRPIRSRRSTSAQDTPFPSLELCIETKAVERRDVQPEFGCGFGSTISFRSAGAAAADGAQPAQAVLPPVRPGRHAAEREAIIAQTGSLLDLVSDERRVGARPARRRRPSAHGRLSRLRARDRAPSAESWPTRTSRSIDLPDAPAGVPPAFDEHINLMFDLAALAYQADLTRVVSFMMAAEISMLTYNQVGVSEAFHPLSHHQNNRRQDGAARRRADVPLEGVRALPGAS